MTITSRLRVHPPLLLARGTARIVQGQSGVGGEEGEGGNATNSAGPVAANRAGERGRRESGTAGTEQKTATRDALPSSALLRTPARAHRPPTRVRKRPLPRKRQLFLSRPPSRILRPSRTGARASRQSCALLVERCSRRICFSHATSIAVGNRRRRRARRSPVASHRPERQPLRVSWPGASRRRASVPPTASRRAHPRRV